MNCPICKTNHSKSYRCDYKFEIFEDRKYLGDLKIDRCEQCDFSFANPMPKDKDLNFFYENIYRLPGRPPYWVKENDENAERKHLENRNLNYLLYASTLIDLKKIENIYDFGAGFGDLGHAIKRKFPNVNLFCTEHDKQCSKVLEKRGYKNDEIEKIDKKFDLIITMHSLEHLPNVEIFNKFYEILRPEGLILFEVPHCTEKYFSSRPSDSPHLVFYTKKSIEKICTKFNFEAFRIDTSSYTFDEDFQFGEDAKNRYYKIKSGTIIDKFKQFIKKLIPQSILKLRETILKSKNINEMVTLGEFTVNSGDNTYLRGILKKK